MQTPKIYFSLTTIPERIEILPKALKSIIDQDGYDKVTKTYLCIDDNLPPETVEKYKKFESRKNRIELKICPAKWRSCNKLIPVYKEHGKDSIIVTWDDDKVYPKDTFSQLLDGHNEHPDCIIAEECNPVIRCPGSTKSTFVIVYQNTVSPKFGQESFDQYLSNACLFPPDCFTDIIYDYDKMMEFTNHHDEQWFRVASTLKGTRVVNLPYIFSYCLEDDVVIPSGVTLSEINGNLQNILDYNIRFNKLFGEEINKVLDKVPVRFFVTPEKEATVTVSALFGADIYLEDTVLPHADGTVTVCE